MGVRVGGRTTDVGVVFYAGRHCWPYVSAFKLAVEQISCSQVKTAAISTAVTVVVLHRFCVTIKSASGHFETTCCGLLSIAVDRNLGRS